MTTYYIGKTKAGQIVKRASTRPDYTHASVEMTRPEGCRPGKLVGRRWIRGDAFGSIAIEHGPVIDLGNCHFSTSAAGADALMPKGWTGEIVLLMKVDAKVYNATIKDAERAPTKQEMDRQLQNTLGRTLNKMFGG
jgi:hypothetical protein